MKVFFPLFSAWPFLSFLPPAFPPGSLPCLSLPAWPVLSIRRNEGKEKLIKCFSSSSQPPTTSFFFPFQAADPDFGALPPQWRLRLFNAHCLKVVCGQSVWGSVDLLQTSKESAFLLAMFGNRNIFVYSIFNYLIFSGFNLSAYPWNQLLYFGIRNRMIVLSVCEIALWLSCMLQWWKLWEIIL